MSFNSDQIIFLINPSSGNGDYLGIIKAIQQYDNAIDHFITRSKEETKTFLETIDPKYKVLVICGGDGTINSVLKYAVNSGLVFAVLPNGSGNGFARELGYKKDVAFTIDRIKKGNTQEIDVLKVNDTYCCNVAGIGFDSFIAKRFEENSKRGLLTYVVETIKGFRNFQGVDAVLTVNNTTEEGSYFMICFANTRQFGNNAVIAPKADPHDGLIDVVVIRKFHKALIPFIALKLLSRKGKNSKYIRYYKTDTIKVDTRYSLFHTDGEPLVKTDTILNVRISDTIQLIQAQN
ncbi:YegS/Rv2252/BmrU family lipid kinase [Maribellus sp. CM-23]|uniref:diacylglycerol/lipid kinase family protein n=1 Tax=Maribellus sp. CM-23 TaxID=2781026 RepID=UPI001F3383AE|nr:YegS/Rv2252/BmrU family lipid kinase [Maribellus sp. CM-23]MCE4565165.1 YegS/Rv2252/BmrU family lipid kinase [Maribellus sp. CM-23]